MAENDKPRTGFPRPLRATGHCRHYRYERGDLLSGTGPCCAREVSLRKLGAALACMPTPAADAYCPLRQEYTAAERQMWKEFGDALHHRIAQAIAALPAPIPLNTSGHVPCPNCEGGELYYARWDRGAAIQCNTENCAGARFSIERGADWPAKPEEDA
ncbi:hypothetical protein [Acidimangrovimonas sediminis]|uniref:hypothetical protein n=1 Tax=Acidimangrovimonas sediminis TaxID=2056283 RepID=UPI000C803A16|nr:hypothetical protein [Acidimangrovimonas sediminis]